MDLTSIKENEPPTLTQLIQQSHQVSDISIGKVVESMEITASKLPDFTKSTANKPESDHATSDSDVPGRKKKWIF